MILNTDKYRRFGRWLAGLSMLCCTSLYAMPYDAGIASDSAKIVSRIGVEMAPMYVMPTNPYFRGENASSERLWSAFSARVKYSLSLTSATRLGRLYPGAYQGIGFGVSAFFPTHELGTPVGIYAFQGAPVHRFSNRMSVNYEWNFGAMYGWQNFNTETNPLNFVVGSKATAYIGLAFLLNYRLSSRMTLLAGLELAHYSNGNTVWPNAGVNTLGVRLGASYALGRVEGMQVPASAEEAMQADRHRWSCDVMAYAALRKKVIHLDEDKFLLPGHMGVLGINVTPMYVVNRYFRFGPSADIQYDESSNLMSHRVEGTYGEDSKFYRPSAISQISWGISARAELTMPFFSVNVGYGRNLVGPRDVRRFYQVLALKAFVSPRLFLHVGYQLNSFKHPNNLMLGVGYRFNP